MPKEYNEIAGLKDVDFSCFPKQSLESGIPVTSQPIRCENTGLGSATPANLDIRAAVLLSHPDADN